jgi:chromate transport protein ChrA/rhodanese-related sulfurtransferase
MDTAATSVPFISPIDLRARLGRADAPMLLDVRREGKFATSPRLLAGAVRCAPEDVALLAATQPPREVVVYCVYGHNVSADAVAALRAAGWPAMALAGGIESGQDGVDTPQDLARWRAAPPPSIAKRPDLGVTGEQPSRWITRERPKIDRIACPWLIRRFIDPRAEFFYVPTAQVSSEAARLKAVAYDIPNAPITHVGEACSFDAVLAAFDLEDGALDRLATIVPCSWPRRCASGSSWASSASAGPAGQIALMHTELVERRRWISERRFLHALNYCMLLPGPEAQQLATYIGWLMHRTWGGIVAGVLFVLPSLFILIGAVLGLRAFWRRAAGGRHSSTASSRRWRRIVLHAAWRIGKTRALRRTPLAVGAGWRLASWPSRAADAVSRPSWFGRGA